MVDTLKYSILKTLVFFDIFDHPLTSKELFDFLLLEDGEFLGEENLEKINKISFEDFLEKIETYKNIGEINFLDGFWFLHNKKEVVEKRKKRVKILNRKMIIAKKAFEKISFLPFLRSVFICNTIPYGIVDENSDIDVFVVIKKNRIWLTRLLITVFLSLYGLRRNNKKIKDKICLSFFVSDNFLNLNSIKITGFDIYLVYWIKNLLPIYDKDKLKKSINRANVWVDQYFKKTNYNFETSDLWIVEDSHFKNKIKIILESILKNKTGDFLEFCTKKIQKIKMRKKYQKREEQTAVVISDNILKFHENDRRRFYQEKWLQNCKKIGIKI